MKNVTYEDIKKIIDTHTMDNRMSVVAYCIGYYGAVDENIFNHINKAMVEEIIEP